MHFANKSGSFWRCGSSKSKRSILRLRERAPLLAWCGINGDHRLTWTSASGKERPNSGCGRWLVREWVHFFFFFLPSNTSLPFRRVLHSWCSSTFFSHFPYFNWKLGVGLSPTQSYSSRPGAMDAPLFFNSLTPESFILLLPAFHKFPRLLISSAARFIKSSAPSLWLMARIAKLSTAFPWPWQNNLLLWSSSQ